MFCFSCPDPAQGCRCCSQELKIPIYFLNQVHAPGCKFNIRHSPFKHRKDEQGSSWDIWVFTGFWPEDGEWFYPG